MERKPVTMFKFGARFLLVVTLSRSSRTRPTGPRLSFEPRITVEPVEQGRETATNFALHNTGDSPLRIYDVTTGCGCATPEIMVDGKPYSIRELKLQPGERNTLRLRWSARGNVGAEQHTALRFRSNDPTAEEGYIDFVMPRLLGGVHTQPLELPPLELVLGCPLTQRVAVINRSVLPYKVVGVDLVDLTGVATARLVPANDDATAGDEMGRVIGAVEVALTPSTVGAFSGYLQVNVEGGVSRMIRLPLTVNVVGTVTLAPATVTLPRRTSEGLTYEVKVLCRDRTGEPIDVCADETNSPIHIQTMPSKLPTPTRILRVEWTDLMAGADDREVPIRIRRSRTGASEVVHLRVCHRPTPRD